MSEHGHFTAIAYPVAAESGFMTECLDLIKLDPAVNFVRVSCFDESSKCDVPAFTVFCSNFYGLTAKQHGTSDYVWVHDYVTVVVTSADFWHRQILFNCIKKQYNSWGFRL